MLIDLHTHSTFSDGTDKPAELLAAASAVGIDVIAVTDHDTSDGWADAVASLPPSMTLVRGAEFSTQLQAPGGGTMSVHLLGYLFDPADPAVVAEQARLVAERLGRGMQIVDNLIAAGVPITRERVRAIAGRAPVGRPHIGRALVEAGLVTTVTEAFHRYLASDGPHYVQKLDTDLDSAVAMIAAAGGVSVLAHPWGRGAASVLTTDRLAALAAGGLHGIEVDHPDHSSQVRGELRALAHDLGLIVTGSSDYHGTNKSLRLAQESTAEDQLARIIDASSGLVVPIGPALP